MSFLRDGTLLRDHEIGACDVELVDAPNIVAVFVRGAENFRDGAIEGVGFFAELDFGTAPPAVTAEGDIDCDKAFF